MTPITTVDGIRNLRSGDYVGYYRSGSGIKEVAVAKVVVELGRIVLRPTMSMETFVVLPDRVYLSDIKEDVSL